MICANIVLLADCAEDKATREMKVTASKDGIE
jgi:hypothetical protein